MNITEVEKIALDVLKTTGKHTAQLILCKNNSVEMHVLCFRNDEEKDKMIEIYRKLVNSNCIDKYFMVTEAWMSDNIYIRPSENKNRKECLIIQEFRSDLFCQSIINIFHRENKKIVFDDRQKVVYGKDTKEFKTIWNFYLEDVMDESMQNVYLDEFIKSVGGKKKFDESMDKLVNVGTKIMNLTSPEDKKKLRDTAIKMIREGKVVPKDKIEDKIENVQ